LLHQESFDMILVNNPSFYDGVLQKYLLQCDLLNVVVKY
jgi:hypothetical protein